MRNAFNITHWWYLTVSEYPRVELSFKLNKAWQCKTLFSNQISQVCLCYADDLNRWVDLSCQQSLKVSTTPAAFIPLDHWNHCVSSSSNGDRTDDTQEYAVCVSGEFVTHISLLEWQPSEARRKLRIETFTHAHVLTDRQLTDTEVWCVNRAIFRGWCGSFWFLPAVWIIENKQGNCSVQIWQVWTQPTFCHGSFHASFCHKNCFISAFHLECFVQSLHFSLRNVKFSIQRPLTANK